MSTLSASIAAVPLGAKAKAQPSIARLLGGGRSP
jgi:hypothetical protein